MCKILVKLLVICAVIVHFSAAVAAEDDITSSICDVFKEHPDWYKAARAAEKKWGDASQCANGDYPSRIAFQSQSTPGSQSRVKSCAVETSIVRLWLCAST